MHYCYRAQCYITSFILTFLILGSVANRNSVYEMNGKYY